MGIPDFQKLDKWEDTFFFTLQQIYSYNIQISFFVLHNGVSKSNCFVLRNGVNKSDFFVVT